MTQKTICVCDICDTPIRDLVSGNSLEIAFVEDVQVKLVVSSPTHEHVCVKCIAQLLSAFAGGIGLVASRQENRKS